ncbi:6970_t:CDS:2, partial [Scutellospora calospora]
ELPHPEKFERLDVRGKNVQDKLRPFNYNLEAWQLAHPHKIYKKTVTAQDFAENDFVIAHLQSYFQSQENAYKARLLQELTTQPTNFPPYQMLLAEKEKLQLIVEGYRLGTTKTSKVKGEELEKYILEQLQITYNGADDINRITHIGTKADISQLIHNNNHQEVGKIIYEIKNEDK